MKVTGLNKALLIKLVDLMGDDEVIVLNQYDMDTINERILQATEPPAETAKRFAALFRKEYAYYFKNVRPSNKRNDEYHKETIYHTLRRNVDCQRIINPERRFLAWAESLKPLDGPRAKASRAMYEKVEDFLGQRLGDWYKEYDIKVGYRESLQQRQYNQLPGNYWGDL